MSTAENGFAGRLYRWLGHKYVAVIIAGNGVILGLDLLWHFLIRVRTHTAFCIVSFLAGLGLLAGMTLTAINREVADKDRWDDLALWAITVVACGMIVISIAIVASQMAASLGHRAFGFMG